MSKDWRVWKIQIKAMPVATDSQGPLAEAP